jgi:site-specific DNA-cytosine methylase
MTQEHTKHMRFGSVCSGIEAASVAWRPLGWEAAWLSEIEPFPCAVLKHHYPDVPNYGDMTALPERILSGEIEAPDVFCGGTPCQAFSVAGLRNSLDDARGNLSLTFVGIANAIDHVRSVRSDPPGIIFWENVPGVLSTKDNAFGCFLAGLAGEDKPLEPPRGKWTNAGYMLGPKRAVAWRLLDAQYFGLAQRRKRVFVVASARTDFDPAAVLFEFDGVRRDIAPSREAGKVTPTISASGTGVSGVGFNCEDEWFIETPIVTMAHEQGGAEISVNRSPTLTCNHEAPIAAYAIQGSMIGKNDNAGPQGDGINEEICFTQNTIDRHAVVQPIAFEPGKMQRLGYGNAKPGLAPTLRADAKDNQLAVAFQETADCLTAAYGTNWNGNASATNGSLFAAQAISLQDVTPREKAQNGRGWNDDGTAYTVDTHATQGVAQPIPINSMNAFRSADADPTTGCGIGEAGEAMFTITKANHHAVAQPIAFSRNDDDRDATTDLSPTMRVAGRAGEMLGVAQPVAFAQNQRDEVRIMQVAGALAAEPGMKQQTFLAQPIAMRESGQGYWMEDDKAGTLRAEEENRPSRPSHVIAQPINIYGGNKRADRPEGGFYVRMDEDTTKTLDAASGLNPTCAQGGTAVMQPIGWSEELTANIDLAGTIQRGGQGGRHDGVMTQAMAVRRLIPVEVERLQGFPDNYTNIPWRKKIDAPDGPRYKALGNSWAVPVVRWIGKRINSALQK